ncbi:MAG: hypothetical protein JOZ58_27505, partial [Acetobacteraceae bacterium]|nr:hypothetical protein [Acetobacteraceae bacterium]
MRGNSVTYAQLLETNNLIQVFSDESYWLCVTRTTQESKLFPVPAYMLLSYLNAYYRYPPLLRKVETRLSAEECGDRARNMGSKTDTLNMGWCVPGFYLMGREWLINMGLLRPEDGVEDLIYVMDFWKRVQLSYHRNDGHMTNKEFGHRSQFLPERTLQVFEADLFEVSPGDKLHAAANKFMATVSQYQFLSHCECRIGISNQGPYDFGESGQLIVRDFMDLGEGDYPWLDGIASDVQYNNLTVPMVLKDTNVFLMDDWGSFESEPEFRADNIAAIGLYTSDPLTEGYVPVSMESREALTDMFDRLQDTFAHATTRLWQRIAGWSRAEMIDAGALVYFSIAKDLAHMAGTYEQSDWMEIDQRARRFVPVLNDEFSRDSLTELLGLLSLPSQQLNEYTMSQHNNKAKRTCSLIPYGILATGDYTASARPIFPGDTALALKRGKWRTSRGLLDQDEYNRAVRDFTPAACTDRFRFLDDLWIKYY